MGQSRNENILEATIAGTSYSEPPQSRIENLLLQLKEAIEQGGGGSTPTAANVSYDNTTSGMTADDVQDAIDEVFQSVSSGKTLVAGAITDKGVTTSASDTFATMAANIAAIPTGGSSEVYKYTVGTYTGTVTKTTTIQNSGTLCCMMIDDMHSQTATMTVNGTSVSPTIQNYFQGLGYNYFETAVNAGDTVVTTYYGNSGGSTRCVMLLAVDMSENAPTRQIIADGLYSQAAYLEQSRDFTIEVTGTLDISVVSSLGSYAIKLNGTSVPYTLGFNDSAYRNNAYAWHGISVAKNDVLTVTTGTASYTASIYESIIVTPTS